MKDNVNGASKIKNKTNETSNETSHPYNKLELGF